jgi:hypothetical protein
MNIDLDYLIENSTITIRLLEKSKYLAQACVDIANTGWEIRNFLIGRSEDGDGIWVMPPHWGRAGTKYKGASYHTFINDETAWSTLTQKILDAYREELILKLK